MYIEVTFCDFCDAFRSADRNGNFTYEGKRALFDYLEQYESDSGELVILDVIALCCEYSEMTTSEVVDCYGLDVSELDDDDDIKEMVREYLEHNSVIVGETSHGFVFAEF